MKNTFKNDRREFNRFEIDGIEQFLINTIEGVEIETYNDKALHFTHDGKSCAAFLVNNDDLHVIIVNDDEENTFIMAEFDFSNDVWMIYKGNYNFTGEIYEFI